MMCSPVLQALARHWPCEKWFVDGRVLDFLENMPPDDSKA